MLLRIKGRIQNIRQMRREWENNESMFSGCLGFQCLGKFKGYCCACRNIS